MDVTSVSACMLMWTATVVVPPSSSCMRWCIARNSAGLRRMVRRTFMEGMRGMDEPGYGRGSNEPEWLAVKSRGPHPILQQSSMGIGSSQTMENRIVAQDTCATYLH